jgi:hypothetical protein
VADDARLAEIERRHADWFKYAHAWEWDDADPLELQMADSDVPWLIARVRELETALQGVFYDGESPEGCGACEDGWSDSAEHTCRLGEQR